MFFKRGKVLVIAQFLLKIILSNFKKRGFHTPGPSCVDKSFKKILITTFAKLTWILESLFASYFLLDIVFSEINL